MGTHDDNERDPVIARALGQVPVPPRPPDFLDRLDDALDEVDEERRSPSAAVAAATPAPATPTTRQGETVPVDLTDPRSDTDVADLSARRRQKSGRRFRVLAAAASVAVILGGVAVLTRDDGTTTTVNPAGEPPGASQTATESRKERLSGLESATKAVVEWSRTVSAGDRDSAWSLMGPLSQAYLTDQGGWEDLFVAMSEGSFGKWHAGGMPTSMEASPDGEVRDATGENQAGHRIRAAFLPDTEEAAVVTLSGVFELEGNREQVLDAFPLTRDADGPWRIEPFAFGPGETMAEFVAPGLAEGGGLEDVERGFTLEVHGPGADLVAVQVWAEQPEQASVSGAGFQAMETIGEDRWSAPFSKDLPAGSLQLVVVTRGPDFITTHPVEIFVKGGPSAACPNVGFTPNSDDVASTITISGGECAEAERIVRHVHEELKHNFFDGPRYFTALGYECTVRTDSEGLEKGLYRCTEGTTLVSWTKT